MGRQSLTTLILVAMLLGIGVGYMCHELWPDPAVAKSIAEYISLFTDIFLRLIKMIIAPLVFSTLVVGVAHMGDTRAVGRIGGKAMLWFLFPPSKSGNREALPGADCARSRGTANVDSRTRPDPPKRPADVRGCPSSHRGGRVKKIER